MPAFVIVQQSGKVGETVGAVLCDPGALGFPDRGSDTPVRVKFISDRTLCVNDEPVTVIHCTDGVADGRHRRAIAVRDAPSV